MRCSVSAVTALLRLLGLLLLLLLLLVMVVGGAVTSHTAGAEDASSCVRFTMNELAVVSCN